MRRSDRGGSAGGRAGPLGLLVHDDVGGNAGHTRTGRLPVRTQRRGFSIVMPKRRSCEEPHCIFHAIFSPVNPEFSLLHMTGVP